MLNVVWKKGKKCPSYQLPFSKIYINICILTLSIFLTLYLVIALSSCGWKDARGKENSEVGNIKQEDEGQKTDSSNGSVSEKPKEESKAEKKTEEMAKDKENSNEKKENSGIPVEVSEILVKDISSFLTSTTNIEAEYEATVLAEIDGRVIKIHKEEGDKVKKGELLTKLDDEEKIIALKKAKVKAENEEANYERSKELYSQNLLSSEAFDEVKYQYKMAKSELEEAQYNLSKTKIVAPFNGEVTVRHIKLGQNVKPTDPLFTVANRDLLVANIYLPEKDVLSLKVDQEVKISVPWEETTRYSGAIERISPIVDSRTGTVKVTIYARNLPELIKPGSFVNISIVKEVHNNAILIPKKSIIKDFQENFVFVVKEDIARKVKVEIGFEDNGYVEILSGLNPEQKVVSVGQGGLKDGSKIRIIAS